MNTSTETPVVYPQTLAGLNVLVSDKRLEGLIQTITNMAEARKLRPVGFTDGWYTQSRDGFTVMAKDEQNAIHYFRVELRRWLSDWAGCSVVLPKNEATCYYSFQGTELVNL